jgi:DnaJ-class molecular chaperone
MAKTHYDWLEVAETASTAVVKGAFKFLVQKLHPDKNPENPELTRLQMREISIAFQTLSDPVSRARYDRWLSEQRRNNPAFDRRRRHRPPSVPGTISPNAASTLKPTSGKVDTWV